MAGPVRVIKKPGLRSAGPAPPPITTPSPGTTAVDDMDIVDDAHATDGHSSDDFVQVDVSNTGVSNAQLANRRAISHVTVPVRTSSAIVPSTQVTARAEVSRLSQSLEAHHLESDHADSSQRSDTMEPPDVSILGEGVKDLINVVSELTKLGLEQCNIPLVRCVVCGDQSAGKSSVIEAISGITVPRAGGTCTRCPMYIQLQSSTDPASKWQARVCIRKNYQYIPTGRDAARQKYHSWSQKVPVEEVEFAQTGSVDHLSLLIFRAQLAVLNPGEHYSSYVPGSPTEITSDGRQAEFSPNVVCIYITAPNLPNLSFYDLPGIIVGRGDKAKEPLRKFVEALVKDYIADVHTLVLLTSSLEIDWDVASHAATLVTRTKATDRCVGVLTKPDRIDTSDRYKAVERALSGELDPLGHGYYVVKSPSQNALEQQITHQEARADEANFFSQKQPWATKLASFENRFGTKNLQTALSEKLAALSSKSLPGIQLQLQHRLQEIDEELASIPKPLTRDAISNVTNALHAFTDRLKKELNRKGTNNRWKPTWDALQDEFRKQLDSFKPLLLTEGVKDELSFVLPETVDLCSDDEYGAPVGLSAPETPNKRKREQTVPATPQTSRQVPEQETPNKKQRSNAHPETLRFNLDNTRSDIYKLSSASIPGHTDPKAVEELMRRGLQLHQWKKLVQLFLRDLEVKLSKRMSEILEDSLAKWRTTEFFRLSLQVINDAISEYMNEQRTVIAPDILSDQAGKPYIFSNPFYAPLLEQAKKDFREARIRRRRAIYFRVTQEQTGKVLPEKIREEQAKKDPARSIIENDPYAEELQVIAQVRAYYTIAAVRIREALCMRVESQLFKGLRETLLDKLNDGLGIIDDDGKVHTYYILQSANSYPVHQRCVQLLAEDPIREARRQELELKKKDLLAGKQILSSHFKKYDVKDSQDDTEDADAEEELGDDHDELYDD